MRLGLTRSPNLPGAVIVVVLAAVLVTSLIASQVVFVRCTPNVVTDKFEYEICERIAYERPRALIAFGPPVAVFLTALTRRRLAVLAVATAALAFDVAIMIAVLI